MKAIHEVLSPLRIYCLTFAEEIVAYHCHIFPRSDEMTFHYLTGCGRTRFEMISAPNAMPSHIKSLAAAARAPAGMAAAHPAMQHSTPAMPAKRRAFAGCETALKRVCNPRSLLP